MSTSRVLAQVFLFSGLSAADIDVLAASLQKRRYGKGEFIFHLDDPGTTCYIIESGRVKIGVVSPEGKQVTLALLGKGDLFGELALLDGDTRSADVVALEPCHLLELSRAGLMAFLHEHPEAAVKLLSALAGRLRRTDEMLEDAVFLRVPGRLAKVLLDVAERQGQVTPRGISIDPFLTQAELAALVGTTRESVNKWLGFYQQRGLIKLDGGKIIIRRPEELHQQIY